MKERFVPMRLLRKLLMRLVLVQGSGRDSAIRRRRKEGWFAGGGEGLVSRKRRKKGFFMVSQFGSGNPFFDLCL